MQTFFKPCTTQSSRWKPVLLHKLIWRQFAVRVPAGLRGEQSGAEQMPRQAAGNHPPSATQDQRRTGSFAQTRSGLRLKAPSAQAPQAFKSPQFAGDHTARDHPFPSRTRKLSLAGPMVLHGRPCGRLGDRRQYILKAIPQGMAFLRLGQFWPRPGLSLEPLNPQLLSGPAANNQTQQPS